MPVTQGTMIKSIVSAVEFLDQREIDPNIYDQARDRALTDIMRLVNRRKPTSMPTYHNFVNNDAYEVCTVSSVGSTGMAQIHVTVNTNTTSLVRAIWLPLVIQTTQAVKVVFKPFPQVQVQLH